ncbi:MAG TPA: N-acyl homoserine lactonase family protein [Candidatus Sulfotelmatobacter sp.]|nr:N-acyl homoserine lactonase family protein [Candidatus Sulfotelmatobacter sp.]
MMKFENRRITRWVKWLAAVIAMLLVATVLARTQAPAYSIQAIRIADSPGDSAAEMVVGAPKDEKIDTMYAVWLIRGGGHNILFDSGFHRERWFKLWTIEDYLRPDQAVRLAGVKPEEITDIVVSHAHWDHMGGIDLFPKAKIWIQKEEFRYYTGDAWQPDGQHGGIDPEDVQELVKLNTEGRVRFVDGDNVEIFPGIRAYTGGHHTYASQYLLVDGNPRFVLASDNVYLYRNLVEHAASATFSDADHAANIAAQKRMIELAGSIDRVVPGHDALQFKKFKTIGRITQIR